MDKPSIYACWLRNLVNGHTFDIFADQKIPFLNSPLPFFLTLIKFVDRINIPNFLIQRRK